MAIQGALTAFFIALLFSLWDGVAWRRSFVAGFICGFVALAVVSFLAQSGVTDTPCDGSIVVCKLAGEFHIRRFKMYPCKHLESLGGDGRKERINSEDEDGIFGVITHAVNDMRNMEFDDNPAM